MWATTASIDMPTAMSLLRRMMAAISTGKIAMRIARKASRKRPHTLSNRLCTGATRTEATALEDYFDLEGENMFTAEIKACGRTFNIDPELIAKYRKVFQMGKNERIEDELRIMQSDYPNIKKVTQEEADRIAANWLKEGIEMASRPVDTEYLEELLKKRKEREESC